MKVIEKSGSSVAELVSQFRKENGLKEWEVDYDVLVEASSGFLGMFGKKPAKVQFKIAEPTQRVQRFVELLLEHLNLNFSNVETKIEGKTVYAIIHECNDPGFLIGKNGSMLETLQYLLNRIFESCRDIDKVYLDSEGYRTRREEQYLRLYVPKIVKVKSSGKSLTLDPMNAGERRIIHKYIERDRNLRTLTIGEGEKKRIVVFSSKQSEKDVLSQMKADGNQDVKPVRDSQKTPSRPRKPYKARPKKEAVKES